jgi:hypothetical protein
MSKTKRKPKRLLRFTADDTMGGWRKGDAAVDEGWEACDEHGNPTTGVRMLRLMRTGELLSVSEPFRRRLVEATGRSAGSSGEGSTIITATQEENDGT